MAFENLLKPAVILLPALIILYVIYVAPTLESSSSALKQLPWVGRRSELFSKRRAIWRSLGNARKLLEDSYSKYTKRSSCCIIPDFGRGYQVMMPSSQIPWILDQSEHILSVTEAHIDTLEADYTFDPYVTRHLTHIPVIRRDLTRHLGSLTSDLMEEIGLGFDQYWGSDTENWKEVCIYDVMIRIVARASNRVLVGLPLCRNQEFLMNAVKFVQSTPFMAQFIKLFPKFLKPVIGRITTIPSHYFYSKCAKHLVPLAEQRMADLEKKQREFGNKFVGPNDFLTWMIHDAKRRADTVDQSPEVLCRRMLIANFASLHTTTFTITNVLFDLISSPPEKGDLASIREEMERVLRKDHGVWTKAGLTKLVRAESAIKETMRLWGILGTSLVRKVIADEGITLENGLHLDKGAYLGVPSHGIHHDETIYAHANVYDASRFSRPCETLSASQDVSVDDGIGAIAVDEKAIKKDSEIKVEEGLGSKGLSATTTSDTFLSFSLGRHACPGRFFAVDLLKLLMAYAFLHYEIKLLPERPSNTWFGEALLPPMKATVQVKRRRSEGPMADGQLETLETLGIEGECRHHLRPAGSQGRYIKAGVKSMAVRFQHSTKAVLFSTAILQVLLLVAAGILGVFGVSYGYFSINCAGTVIALERLLASSRINLFSNTKIYVLVIPRQELAPENDAG